jgi:hypothetical protein
MKKVNLRSVILNIIVCCTLTGLSTAQETPPFAPLMDKALDCMPLPECWFPNGTK